MEKPILICGNFRGITQPIRYLFAYIQVPYAQFHLNKNNQIQEQGFKIPEQFLEEINCQAMPYLLHQGLCICEIFPIISYICRRFNRQDLLGKNLTDKSQVFQIAQRIAKRKSQKYKLLLSFIITVKQNPTDITITRKKFLKCYYTTCEYIEPMLKQYKNKETFVLGYFSILDIFLYQSLFYLDGLFGEQSFAKCCWIIAYCKQYLKLFSSQPFYQLNRVVLQSKPILYHDIKQQYQTVFRQIWLGNKKLL